MSNRGTLSRQPNTGLPQMDSISVKTNDFNHTHCLILHRDNKYLIHSVRCQQLINRKAMFITPWLLKRNLTQESGGKEKQIVDEFCELRGNAVLFRCTETGYVCVRCKRL